MNPWREEMFFVKIMKKKKCFAMWLQRDLKDFMSMCNKSNYIGFATAEYNIPTNMSETYSCLNSPLKSP